MLKKETIENIASLANIKIENQKIEKIEKDISQILDYVDVLKEVDTSGIDFKAISEIKNRVRPDKSKERDIAEKDNMKAMVKNKDGYFQVELI